MILLLPLACEPEPIRSTPTAPTAELGGEAGGEQPVVWTDLAEVFPTTPCSPPAPLAALAPGMKGAAARDVLTAAHQPGVKMVAQPKGQRLVVSTLLSGYKHVGLTLLLDQGGEALEELQVSVPADAAQPMLTARWGAASEVEFQAEGRSIYRWRCPGATWAVDLQATDRDRAVIRFLRP